MKKQQINWILYLILGILSIIIVALSLLVKEHAEWFTIVSGIGCGAFASVFIAFLIEVSNVSQKKQKNMTVFESYFSKLYFTFANLLCSLVTACDKEKLNGVEELFWFDWLERFIEEQIENPRSSAKEFLANKIQDVEKELAKIEESKLLLLNQDLIDDMEFIAFMNIKGDLSFMESVLNSSDTNWNIMKAIIPELKEHIEESKVLRKFNSVSYKDGLLKLLRIRCYLN